MVFYVEINAHLQSISTKKIKKDRRKEMDLNKRIKKNRSGN